MPSLAPNADGSIGGWTDQAGGTTNLFQAIDETTADDSDFIASSADPVDDTVVILFPDPPATPGEPFTVPFRYEPTADTVGVTVQFRQGVTVIAEWAYSTSAGTKVTEEPELSPEQFAAVGSWTDLSLAFIAGPVGMSLTPSGPVEITANGQTVSGLHITADDEDGIFGNGYSDITIENCLIEVTGDEASGIRLFDIPGLTITNCRVVKADAPSSGAGGDANSVNIYLEGCSNIEIGVVNAEQGSAGVYCLDCEDIHIHDLAGIEFKGPYPRGQFIQINQCGGTVLIEDIFALNPYGSSWTEDIVSIYRTDGVVIRRGLLDGCNSPSGVGVMLEGSSNCLVEDVDCVHMGNGGFTATNADVIDANNNVFRRCCVRDMDTGDLRGEGGPTSGGLAFGSYGSGGMNTLYEDCLWFNLDDGNVIYDLATTQNVWEDFEPWEQDFTQRSGVYNSFPWE